MLGTGTFSHVHVGVYWLLTSPPYSAFPVTPPSTSRFTSLRTSRSAFCVLRFAFCVLHSAFCVLRVAFVLVAHRLLRFAPRRGCVPISCVCADCCAPEAPEASPKSFPNLSVQAHARRVQPPFFLVHPQIRQTAGSGHPRAPALSRTVRLSTPAAPGLRDLPRTPFTKRSRALQRAPHLGRAVYKVPPRQWSHPDRGWPRLVYRLAARQGLLLVEPWGATRVLRVRSQGSRRSRVPSSSESLSL